MSASELDRALEQEVMRLCALGESHFEYGEAALALQHCQQAWALIPEPRTGKRISAVVLAMIGDCHLELEQDHKAQQAFTLALQCHGAKDDPLLHLRLGMVCHELDQHDSARQHLARADALNDADHGDADDPVYAALLKSKIPLSPGHPLPAAR